MLVNCAAVIQYLPDGSVDGVAPQEAFFFPGKWGEPKEKTLLIIFSHEICNQKWVPTAADCVSVPG